MQKVDAIRKILMYESDKTGLVKEPTTDEIVEVLVHLLKKSHGIEAYISKRGEKEPSI